MQVDTWGKSLRLISCKPTYDSSKLQRFLFVSWNVMMRKVFDSKLHNLSRAIQFSLAQLCKPDLFSSFLILSFPMSSPTGNQRKSQSRISKSFSCINVSSFILRFFFQRCYAATSMADWGGWSRHWEIHLSGSSRGPTKGHFCRRVLTLWLQVMYLVMYLRWFLDISDVEISKSEWDTNLRDEGRGMANLNTFLLF